jgi:uncharacterized membrane protein
MPNLFVAVSYWLHALATVIFIGHYVLLSLLYIPALADRGGESLSRASKRSRPWLYTALLIFFLTGGYLTVVDPSYLGLGNFGNAWAILMLTKHLLILVMIAMGFWFNAIQRVGPMLVSNTRSAEAVTRFRRHANLMAALGAIVLLLTAISQAQESAANLLLGRHALADL